MAGMVHNMTIDLVFHLFAIFFSLFVWLITFRGSFLPGKILLSIKGGFKWTLIIYILILFMMGCSFLASGKLQDVALYQESVEIPLGFITSVAVLVGRIVALNFMGNAFKDHKVDSLATLFLGVVILSLTYAMYVESVFDILFWMVNL